MGNNEILAKLSELAKEYPELSINKHFLALQKDLRDRTMEENKNDYINAIFRKAKRRDILLSDDDYFKWMKL